MLMQITEIERPIDASQQVGSRHVIVEIERVKKFALPAIQLTIMMILCSPIDIKRIPNDFKKERLFQKNRPRAATACTAAGGATLPTSAPIRASSASRAIHYRPKPTLPLHLESAIFLE
jgi:hypothetical protein